MSKIYMLNVYYHGTGSRSFPFFYNTEKKAKSARDEFRRVKDVDKVELVSS